MLYVATRPASFRIQRSIRIAAPREKLFAYVADLHNFDAWSPWAPLDPAMRKTHSGAASGVGASYEWQGNATRSATAAWRSSRRWRRSAC
jgi:hypothetical protein